MNTHLITLGLGGALLITLGLASGINAVEFPPAMICLSDAAQTITLSDTPSGSVTLSDAPLEC